MFMDSFLCPFYAAAESIIEVSFFSVIVIFGSKIPI